MSYKHGYTFDELNSLGMTQQNDTDALCQDFSTEALVASLTESDMEDLLINGGYPHVPETTGKWVAEQQRQSAIGEEEEAFDEISFEVSGVNDEPVLLTNASDSSDLVINNRFSGVAPRPNVLQMADPKTRFTYAMPSALVSPSSDKSSPSVAGTTSVSRRRRHDSCSSESESIEASVISGWTNAMTATSTRGGTKRRRGSSRQTVVEKDSEEYRLRRVRNNVAVRKSRDKAKQRQEQTTQKVSNLQRENENLSRQLDSVSQELTLLRSIFSNLGVPIQQLVSDALHSATQKHGTSAQSASTGRHANAK